MLNAPSPAATACLAIGDHINQIAAEYFALAHAAKPKPKVRRKKRKATGGRRKAKGSSKREG